MHCQLSTIPYQTHVKICMALDKLYILKVLQYLEQAVLFEYSIYTR